jgi:hypothetical protein
MNDRRSEVARKIACAVVGERGAVSLMQTLFRPPRQGAAGDPSLSQGSLSLAHPLSHAAGGPEVAVDGGDKPGRGKIGFFGNLVLALHESRARQARHELSRYAHLIAYAREHPLTFGNRTASAGITF